jgi:hypothetical protein
MTSFDLQIEWHPKIIIERKNDKITGLVLVGSGSKIAVVPGVHSKTFGLENRRKKQPNE